MTLARTGVVAAVAGAIALAVHGAVYARHAQQQSDCDAWRRARTIIAKGASARPIWPATSEWASRVVDDALNDPDMDALWRLREFIARYPLAISALVSALHDLDFVGLRNFAGVVVDGRDIPIRGCETRVRDDLFRRAGRASWLLKQATGHPAAIVPKQTDPISLADVAREWQRWLDGLDGGLACFPSLR